MSRLGFKAVIFHGEWRLGELDVIPVSGQNIHFPNEFRIRHISPRSDRCSPLSILQTISAFSVRCKLESLLLLEQPSLINLHAFCFHELKTAVAFVGDEEFHLVAMPSERKKFPCFWCYSVPVGLYNACLGMLNLRCLAIVFDLDETLIVANTLKSFEDRIESLRGWLARETDPLRMLGMSAELKRYMDDRMLLKQYAESDCVIDNGKIIKVQLEEVPPLSDGHEKVVRPVIRLQERNIVLTRINPEIRDTSVLVRLKPAWEDLRCYLNAKGRKRFEVYVCTMAERDYAMEIWRLLDPEAHLISSKQLLDRVICVKSGSRKSLLNVFQDGMCHPNMAMVVDDRSKVWEDRDQPRVHEVPAFTPYYAPQAETATAVPVLRLARNVACNARTCFFKEFDENILQRISNVFYEDEIGSLPHPLDVSNYLMPEGAGFVPNNSTNVLKCEAISAAEVERRSNQSDEKPSVDSVTRSIANNVELKPETSQPTAGVISNKIFPGSSRSLMPSPKPGLLGPPVRHNVFSVDRNYDEPCSNNVKRGLTATRLGVNRKGQSSGEPTFISRPPNQALPSLMLTHVGLLAEDDIRSRAQPNNCPAAKESNVAEPDIHRVLSNLFSDSTPVSTPTQSSEMKVKEANFIQDLQRQTLPSHCQLAENGACKNHLSSNGREIPSEAIKLNLLPYVSIRVLKEIGRRCSSKVEFRSVVSTRKDLQFSVEVLFTGDKIGIGMARTRKDAHQQAAENALHNLADKYKAHMEPQCRAVDREFDKLSLGHDNGFLWDVVNPESSELQGEDALPKESVSETRYVETSFLTPNGINQQLEKHASSPRLPIPVKRVKE